MLSAVGVKVYIPTSVQSWRTVTLSGARKRYSHIPPLVITAGSSVTPIVTGVPNVQFSEGVYTAFGFTFVTGVIFAVAVEEQPAVVPVTVYVVVVAGITFTVGDVAEGV